MNKPASPIITAPMTTRINRRDFLIQTATIASACLLASPNTNLWARTSLNTQVNSLIQSMRAQGRIQGSEQTSWSVYDFTKGQKLVALNEDTPRQAASMIKPFIALAFFYTVTREGSPLHYSATIRQTMEQMIRRSSNVATNTLMHLVSKHNGNRGPQDIERVLKEWAPGVFQQTRIVEYIPANGRTYRNQASAHDYSRFLYALWNDQLPYAHELRTLMALPNRDRITTGVSTIPAHVKVYDKTGSTSRLCGNMGIVEGHSRYGKRCAYTFVGIIERTSRTTAYYKWIKDRGNVMREVSDLVYAYMKDRHQLV
jgi:beta-lactamase class A